MYTRVVEPISTTRRRLVRDGIWTFQRDSPYTDSDPPRGRNVSLHSQDTCALLWLQARLQKRDTVDGNRGKPWMKEKP